MEFRKIINCLVLVIVETTADINNIQNPNVEVELLYLMFFLVCLKNGLSLRSLD